MRRIAFKALVCKLLNILVILLIQDGFENECPEKSSKQSLPNKVSLKM